MAHRYLPASSSKLRRAREEGDVAKSRELSFAAVLCATGFAGYLLRGKVSDFIELSRALLAGGGDFSMDRVVRYLHVFAGELTLLLGQCLVAGFIAGAIVELLQVGLQISFKPLGFQLSRLNVASGLLRLFGLGEEGEGFFIRVVAEIAKYAIISCIWLGVLFYLGLWLVQGAPVSALTGMEMVAELVGISLKRIFLGALVVVVVYGAAELYIARRRRAARLLMDIDEFRRDLRENEGSPEMKGMRKQRHHEIALHSVIEGVRKAKVLITGAGC